MKTSHRWLIVLAFLSVVGNFAQSATVAVTWTNPTTNTDASAIPATGDGSLQTWRLEYGTCNGTAFGTKAGEVTRTRPNASTPLTSTTLNLNPGTTCVRAYVANSYGAESAASNVLTRVIDPPVPQPPTLVTIAQTAYNVKPDYGRFVFVRASKAGTVRLGAACDASRATADGYYAIDRRNMVTPRPAEGVVVVAKCA